MGLFRILDPTDMAQARTPDDLHAWVLRKCKELSASPEVKTYARSGAKLPKKFYDEIFPLATFAIREYGGRTDVLIKPNLSSDGFDAEVMFEEPQARTLYVETTFAKDGYDESLRMEVLEKDGHVFLTGPVFKSGRRGAPDRTVTVAPEAACRSEQLASYLNLIEARVEAKAKARYGKDHVLLVAVDDYLPLAQDYDWPRVDERAREWIQRFNLDFGRVVFVGVAGRLALSYSLPLDRAEESAR
jgi:hypothetical protein